MIATPLSAEATTTAAPENGYASTTPSKSSSVPTNPIVPGKPTHARPVNAKAMASSGALE
jgi:hypothetical protein